MLTTEQNDNVLPREEYKMGKPKKRTSARKTGLRRSHIVLKLARAVNSKSPVKARTTAKQSGKKLRKAPAAK